ncbi:[Fe-S]-binding protein [Roseiconus nitratireducens]|uniref:[Fe-S]-binding protein n=1 Tax=Roseiconus nitratireducens TaxID=2605748 RepID=A0A5M6DH20_9BACT|nr:[Fe-S]-binding protein [Roseiconus nitratireducens]KAA5545552.1 [Fe-S]-binding protein [Roseiconus nitratireducens]
MSGIAVEFPRFFRLHQSFATQSLGDPAAVTTEQLQASAAAASICRGETVAIGVGSRGIHQIADVTRAVVAWFHRLGAVPFVVPAMGSHGGATAEGQIGVLRSLGITPESIGCPIRATMETVSAGTTSDGIALQSDRWAASADHLVLINRVKPHTRLTGSIQSGLCKMLMIGLGNHDGAVAFHQGFKAFDYRLDQIAGDIVGKLKATLPLRLGVAIVENACEQIGHIEVVAADDFLHADQRLLRQATQWMPRLPFDRAELLIVDEIGKEISGTGMDSNVIGRKSNDKLAASDEWPKIDEIYVRGLTPATAGNASGIGIAEYTHRRVADGIDRIKTRINCVTAGHATAAAMPVYFDSDREVLEAVRRQSHLESQQCRWLWIRNTLDLAEIRCSEAYLDDVADRQDVRVDGPCVPLEFDGSGDLTEEDRRGDP